MSGNEVKQQGLSHLSIVQLRGMAKRFLGDSTEESEQKTKSELISLLSSTAGNNQALRREINKLEVAIRPSFYLVNIIPQGNIDYQINKRVIIQRILNNIRSFNQSNEVNESLPSPRELKYESMDSSQDSLVEVQFTWQRIHWYWNQNVQYRHIYELRYGYAILDFRSLRGMLICQTQNERRMIEQAIEGIAPMKLTTQQLTKELLEQIGEFDRVKSAKYQRHDLTSDKPFEIRYADEELATKPQVREEETDPFSDRVESFYRIPIAGIEEYGIGATSRTGKLWLPRMTPLDTVRDFGIELLGKVTETVDGMVKSGEYDQVLSTLGLYNLEEINSINPLRVRELVLKLIHNIANMVLQNETSRPFEITDVLAIDAAGKLFFDPVIDLFDESIDSTARWRDENGKQFVKIKRDDRGELIAHHSPRGSELDLSRLRHPISGNEIDVNGNLFDNVHLYPKPELVDALITSLHIAGSRLGKLLEINNLPFVIANHRLTLDLTRITGDHPPVDINTSEIREFRTVNTQTVTSRRREEIIKKLEKLGEKCKNESAQNCSTCLSDNQYVCLRYIVARTSSPSIVNLRIETF